MQIIFVKICKVIVRNWVSWECVCAEHPNIFCIAVATICLSLACTLAGKLAGGVYGRFKSGSFGTDTPPIVTAFPVEVVVVAMVVVAIVVVAMLPVVLGARAL